MSEHVHHDDLHAATSPEMISFKLNGELIEVRQPPFRRLLDVLRVDLGMTGTKEGCSEGECGACTVLLDGMPVNSCLVPIAQVQGHEIVTIEGVGSEQGMHPVQEAFIEHGGAQCGICTPGMVVTASWMVDEGLPAEDIEKVMAGNICRCTGYAAIVRSVQSAMDAVREGEQEAADKTEANAAAMER